MNNGTRVVPLYLAVIACLVGVACGEAPVAHSPVAVRETSCADALEALIAGQQDGRAVPGNLDDACWLHVRQRPGLVRAMVLQVETGDLTIAHLLARRVRDLDGGELEDALRAYGTLSSQHAGELLALVHSGAITTVEFTNAITMLPLSLSDDFDAQLRELELRKAAMRNIEEPAFQRYIADAVREIDTFVSEINAARASQ